MDFTRVDREIEAHEVVENWSVELPMDGLFAMNHHGVCFYLACSLLINMLPRENSVPGSMIPLALILLRRRPDVPGTRTNHLICLILLNAMADPADGSS